MHRKKLASLTAAIALVGGLSACATDETAATRSEPQQPAATTSAGDSQVAFIDGPIFDSIDELADSSDLVVIGTFTQQNRSTTESELLEDWRSDRSGLPLDLWGFTVDQSVVGDLAPGTEIEVTQINTAQVATEEASGVAGEGVRAALFLRAYPDQDNVFAVTGLGQGALSISETGALTAPANASDSLRGQIQDDLTATDLGPALR